MKRTCTIILFFFLCISAVGGAGYWCGFDTFLMLRWRLAKGEIAEHTVMTVMPVEPVSSMEEEEGDLVLSHGLFSCLCFGGIAVSSSEGWSFYTLTNDTLFSVLTDHIPDLTHQFAWNAIDLGLLSMKGSSVHTLSSSYINTKTFVYAQEPLQYSELKRLVTRGAAVSVAHRKQTNIALAVILNSL